MGYSSESDSSESENEGGMSLFKSTVKGKRPRPVSEKSTAMISKSQNVEESSAPREEMVEYETMGDLGLSDWLVKSCGNMGIHKPTPVQQNCVPQILKGENVIGSAPTGSGKTAAFALPILEKLAVDPYGVFAVVLTPTRELAMQIAEQFSALGAPVSIRCEVVIGGMNMLQQSLALESRPHVVVATPGRLADHCLSAQPPKLGRVRFLVLDEADRLLELGFAKDIQRVVNGINARQSQMMSQVKRQTLLFSATMSTNLNKLRDLAATERTPFEYHENKTATTVAQLDQRYMLVPQQVKHTYLAYVLRRIGPVQDPESNKLLKASGKKRRAAGSRKKKEQKVEVPEYVPGEARAKSMIIFTSSCRSCQLVTEMIEFLGIPAVSLHSQLDQRRRLASLGKFRSGLCSILTATDVASRGLDIPQVDLVVNFDVPRLPDDYVHRVGRTARAGRLGRAVTFITQHDVKLVEEIEGSIGKKMEELDHVDDDDILVLLTKASNAYQAAKMKLVDTGFEEQLALTQKRKRKQRKRSRKLAEES